MREEALKANIILNIRDENYYKKYFPINNNITIRHNKNCLCYNDNTPSIYIINTSKSLEHIEILYELISRGLNIELLPWSSCTSIL